MEQVHLRETERVTVRRGIVKAFADAAKQNPGQPARPDVALEAANEEVPGLVGGNPVAGSVADQDKRTTR
jgi:hypothetical protein